jgi:hypothetical protein
LPVEATYQQLLARAVGQGVGKQSLGAPLLLLLLLLWTKEVKNHESLVQDRKTKKLKSNGWQLIRQKIRDNL